MKGAAIYFLYVMKTAGEAEHLTSCWSKSTNGTQTEQVILSALVLELDRVWTGSRRRCSDLKQEVFRQVSAARQTAALPHSSHFSLETNKRLFSVLRPRGEERRRYQLMSL